MNPGGAKKTKSLFVLALAIIAAFLLITKTNLLRGPARQPAQGEWQSMPDVNLSNGLVGVAFTDSGEAGAILVNSGQVILSQDGGVNWRKTSSSLEDAEMHFTACLAMPSPDRVLFGTTVDDGSPYAAVYEVTSSGRQRVVWSGEYGGLLGASPDGRFFVGNNGLLLKLEGDNPQAVQAPQCGQVVLYGVSQQQERVIAVGASGTVLISEDGGRTWGCKQLDGRPELHRVVQTDKAVLVAGDRGAIWRYEPATQAWSKASGVQSWMSVWALYLNGDGEAYAAGGDDQATRPFILRSSDGGKTWTQEPVRGTNSRVMGVALGKAGLFAVSFDGHVLIRGPAT